MAYTKDDLRSKMNSGRSVPTLSQGGVAAPEFLDFTVLSPDVVTDAGSEQWITRGQNAVIAYTQPSDGDVVWEGSTLFEQMLLFVHENSGARITADGQERDVSGETLVIVPPGESRIVAAGAGAIVQILQSDEPGWADRASNADSYREPHPNVALLQPWPEPVGGYRLRIYPMSEVPQQTGRFGRLFRSRAFMVNFINAGNGPRSPQRMSPHFHDDFEQFSLTVSGTYIHHIQTPWGADLDAWRPDDHALVNSPSITVIPPPTIHTSQSITRGRNHLIDIFSGPRADFSAQPGWVLNADEYPAPSA